MFRFKEIAYHLNEWNIYNGGKHWDINSIYYAYTSMLKSTSLK